MRSDGVSELCAIVNKSLRRYIRTCRGSQAHKRKSSTRTCNDRKKFARTERKQRLHVNQSFNSRTRTQPPRLRTRSRCRNALACPVLCLCGYKLSEARRLDSEHHHDAFGSKRYNDESEMRFGVCIATVRTLDNTKAFGNALRTHLSASLREASRRRHVGPGGSPVPSHGARLL